MNWGFCQPPILRKFIGIAEAFPCDTLPSFHTLGSVAQPDRDKESIDNRQTNHQSALDETDESLCPVRRLFDPDHALGLALLKSGNHSQTGEHEQIQESQNCACDIDPEENF